MGMSEPRAKSGVAEALSFIRTDSSLRLNESSRLSLAKESLSPCLNFLKRRRLHVWQEASGGVCRVLRGGGGGVRSGQEGGGRGVWEGKYERRRRLRHDGQPLAGVGGGVPEIAPEGRHP